MKKIVWLLVVSFLVGCSAAPIKNIAYKDRPLSNGRPQTKDYTELGRVSAPMSGFVWSSCDRMADNGLDLLIQNSKNMGGDAVIDVQISECTTRWGWFFAYIIPGLGPWMKTVDVEGVAIKRASVAQ